MCPLYLSGLQFLLWSVDPLYGHAEPIVVSADKPNTVLDMTNPIDRIIRREKDRKLMMSSLSNPIARVHAMDLMDIRYQLNQLKMYVKNQVPALHPLSGLSPGPGEMIDPHLGMSLPGDKVSNICFLLENLSWLVDERVSVQQSAGSHKSDYLAIYRSHFSHKMDISVFSDPKPKKLPQAPKRLRYISSYRSSLRSLRFVGHIRTARGRFSRCHRPIGQARTGDASRAETAASSYPREQFPQI